MQKQRRATPRAVFYALALFSGFVLLALWLTAPDREGSSNLEIGAKLDAQRTNQESDPAIAEKALLALENLQRLPQEPEAVDQVLPEYNNPEDPEGLASAEGPAAVVEAEGQETLLQERLAALEDPEDEERLEAVNQLWYFAADHGVPSEALDALYKLTLDPDPEIAEQALAALEDLQRLLEKSEVVDQNPPEYDNPTDPQGVNLVAEGVETRDSEATERWTGLVMDAVYEPDDDRRSDAVGAVALRRHGEAVVTLTDVAAIDPAPEIRYQTLEALWYAAADGLDADGRIKATLETALADPDPDIAALAKRALEDLQALE